MNFWTSYRESFQNEQTYENLSSGSMVALIPWLIVALFVGIAIAFVVTVFTKRVLGAMVRELLAKEILSAESAKTLEELGFEKNFFLRRAVRGNVSLRRVVRCREEDEFLLMQEESKKDPSLKKMKKVKDFRVDPAMHHFYVPVECRDMASVKFDQKGTSIASLVVWLIVLVIFLIVLLLTLPFIIDMIDSFVGTMKSSATPINDKIV